jgi:predicted glycogen debranching enzyme
MAWRGTSEAEVEKLLTREWLVTNSRGGYASGTIGGAVTRRYHGLLVAALPAKLGRMVMLNHLAEELRLPDGQTVHVWGEEPTGERPQIHGAEHLREFRLEDGLPVWTYEIDGALLEKTVLAPNLQNTIHITYRLRSGPGPLRLRLRASMHFRRHEDQVSVPLAGVYRLCMEGTQYEVCAHEDLPVLRMTLRGAGASLTVDGGATRNVYYRVEDARGYHFRGALWSPGHFSVDLAPGTSATLIASTESWEAIAALSPDEAAAMETQRRDRLLAAAHPAARSGPAAELVYAADQFIIRPAGRPDEEARAHAAGDEVRTVIAGYHWFTDWGRDTMISLEGLTLVTGRHIEAGWILRSFAHYIRDGLIPNMFPEGETDGLYHTADATLWFFHALHRYHQATGDDATIELLLPRLEDIVEHHLRGTLFGIGIDPADALVRQGWFEHPLTWMDAKVEDWIVTPRRGKPVEINALWYNALRLLADWLRARRGEAEARRYTELAQQVRESFNRRYWYEEGGYLYDVLDGDDGDDTACRPNQLFAISLDHPVLERRRWEAVLQTAQERLLTPVGLRSLSADHPDYKRVYFGDLRARDAAYHQGTVWPWLIGAYIDAWVRLHPERRREARSFLDGFLPHLDEACIGSISEVCDAEPPFAPRGCIAQAWSVAEVLRCWVATAEDGAAPTQPRPRA